MTFLLALGGRGFAEFGARGLKIDQVIEQSDTTMYRQQRIDRRTKVMLREIDADMKVIQGEMASHHQRLEILETDR